MDQLRRLLEPVIDLLPPGARPYWYAIPILGAVMALLLLAAIVRGIVQALFGRRTPTATVDLGPRENLAEYPLPAEPWGPRRLTVEGVPVRLRLVVVAPVGKKATVNEAALPQLLDAVVWGLGEIFRTDRPRVRVGPPQLSHQGFVAAFHRSTPTPEPEGQPSRWILVAGQTPSRPRPLLLGLALWADEPVFIGRLTLEPGRWAAVLRVQNWDG